MAERRGMAARKRGMCRRAGALALAALALAAAFVASPTGAMAADTGGNVTVSVPTDVSLVVKADGTVVAPSASAWRIENESDMPVAIASVDGSGLADGLTLCAQSEDTATAGGSATGHWTYSRAGGAGTLTASAGDDSDPLAVAAGSTLGVGWSATLSQALMAKAGPAKVGVGSISIGVSPVAKTAFAVYSADDGSLSFYKRISVPSSGGTFEGKTATAVYVGIESASSQPWSEYSSSIKSTTVVDEGISPYMTMFWFRGCTELSTADLSKLDTGSVSNTINMFSGCYSLASLDLSGWNTSSLCATDYMFYNCWSLTSLDLSNWDTSKVMNMDFMFYGCSSLKTLDLSGWDTSSAESMVMMFSGCTKLQKVSFGASWKWVGTNGYLPTPSSTYISGADGKWYSTDGAGYTASAIPSNKADTYSASKSLLPTAFAVYSEDDNSLSFYKRSGVPSAGDTFEGKTASAVWTGFDTASYTHVTEVPWYGYLPNVASATVVDEGISPVSLAYWFCAYVDNKSYNDALTTVDLSKLDTSKVTSTSCMFWGCRELPSANLSGWDTSKVTNMNNMFRDCNALTAVTGLSAWDTSAVTNMEHMFITCTSLASLDLSNWDTSKVTDMDNMFSGCTKLATITGISGLKTGSVTNLKAMFLACTSLTILDLSNWDTSKVTDMSELFRDCTSLASLSVSGWDTSGVTDMSGAFKNCLALATLDLSSWDTSAVTDTSDLFTGDLALKKVKVGKNWAWVSVSGHLPPLQTTVWTFTASSGSSFKTMSKRAPSKVVGTYTRS